MRLAIIVAFAALSCYGQKIGGKASISGRVTFGAPAVGQAAPTLSSISPNTGVVSTAVSVTLTGTNFISGASVNVPGGNTVSGLSVVSGTQITATITLASNAVSGVVSVTTTGGTSGTQSWTVTQPTGQTTLYLSQIPGVVLDASVSAGTGQTCTDNSAAIQSRLASNVRLVLDGATCIGATASHVCLDLRGLTNVTIEGQGWTTGLYIKDGANCIGITNVYPLPLPNGTFYNAGGTWSAPPSKVASIALKNFRLNGNKAGQACSTGECLGAAIYNVSGVTVDNLYISEVKNIATAFDNVDHVTLTNSTILQAGAGTDPWHINGPADTIDISGNSLQSGDDCVALNAPEGYGGNISGVTITSNVMTGSGCSDFLRIYNNIGGGGNPSYAVSATVDGLTGTATCSVNPAILYFGEAVGYGGPNLLSITATNIDVDGSGNCGLAQVSGSWARMDISNAILRNAKPNYPAVQFTFAGQVATSTISNMTIQRNSSGQSTAWPIQVGQYSNVTNMTLSNNVVTDSGGSYNNSPQWVDIESVTNPGLVSALTFGAPLDAKIDALFSSGSAARVSTVVGPPTPGITSPTQALISYTAPSTAACQIQMSEDPTFATVVHDFNATIFPGSDQDARAESTFGSGTTSRVVVAGKRMTEQGSDSAWYSRALQTNTTHYWRACSGWTASGSFTTANVPLGNTRGELIQHDSTGAAVVPTFPDDRTTWVIDPQTGVAAKRVNTAADGEMSLYSGGRPPVCGTQLVGPWPGYLCAFPANIPLLFYVNPTTGEVRHLGRIFKYSAELLSGLGSAIIDPLDGKSWYPSGDDPAGKKVVKKYTYTGDYFEVAAGAEATLTDSVITLDLNAQLAAFDARFDPTKFGCGFLTGGAYSLISCNRHQQDTYGWMFAMRMSDHAIVGGIYVANNPNSRWCGNHTLSIVPNVPIIQMIPHGLTGTGGELGGARYQTTLVGDITDTATTMTVSSQPTNTSSEPYFQDWAIGDVLIFGIDSGSGREAVTITGGTHPTYTIDRNTKYPPSSSTAHAWPSGSVLTAECGHGTTSFWPEMWWKFLDDPTGLSGGYFPEISDGSHEDINANGRLSDRRGQVGSLLDVINLPWSYEMEFNVTFAGKAARANGEKYSDYPSMPPALPPVGERTWFLSEPDFLGPSAPNAVLVSGQLYSYTPNVGGGDSALNPKHHDLIAMSGSRLLTDISGPGSSIGTTSGDSFKFCVPLAANECRTGSSVGTYYFNAPSVVYADCLGRPGWQFDVCMENVAQQGAYQFGWTPNQVGTSDSALVGFGYSRRLSTGFANPKAVGKMFKPTADGKWGFIQRNAVDILALKIPPTPTLDGVDRSTFIRAPLSITSPGGAVTTAAVEFGYAEYGTVAQHYCTSRREACVVTASTVTDATPFWYVTSEAGSYTRTACASSCTITLPVLPGHVAYYTVKFYDGSGNFVQNGVSGLAMDSIGSAGALSWSTLTNGQWTGMTNAQWTSIKN